MDQKEMEGVTIRAGKSEGSVDFSVVLVCWNNKDYLGPCLRSLYEADLESRFDIVVVDNGSTDGTQEILQSEFPQVQLIQNENNVGLAKASNQGIQATSGRYVLLLNNDTLISDRSLDEMVRFLDATSDAGALGGTLLNPDGSFQAGFAEFPSLVQEFMVSTHLGELLWEGYPSHGRKDQVTEVDWLSSACLLVRRVALKENGLLDEEYFIYGDEADLQYRLRKAGWKTYYLPSVSVVHFGGRSMDRWRRRRMVYRGKMLFFRKNYGRYRTLVLRAMLGFVSIGKLFPWSAICLFPHWRERARRELRSNAEVIGLCMKLV